MTDKTEHKKAQSSSCPTGCTGESKVWMVALLGFLVGLLVMYLALPAISPSEVTITEVPSGTDNSAEHPFVLDKTKAQQIGSLLADTYLLNTKTNISVEYVRYETAGTHAILYYKVGNQEIPIYVSKDYKYLYPSAIEFTKMQSDVATAKKKYLASLSSKPKEPAKPVEIPTSAEPKVYLFVMSNCPYGNQAEAGMESVVKLLADNVSFEPVYIIYNETVHPSYNAESGKCLVGKNNETYCSMHGIYEVEQDVREKIVYNLYGEAVWAEYVSGVNNECFALKKDIGTCWKDVAYNMGLDSALINETYNKDLYTILAKEQQLTFSTETFGSPSLVINGVKYNGARTPEAFKSAICSAFDVAPTNCTTELSATGGTTKGSCN